jgi:hypothetical protein
VPWANVLLDYGIVIQTLQIFYFVYALARIIEVFHASIYFVVLVYWPCAENC